MLSVIIATKDSERALVPTLAALVSGATAGIIREVLVADGGSRDDTAAVAEVAGCNFFVLDGTTERRLKSAADKARARWLLFLRPGTILDRLTIGTAELLRCATPMHDQEGLAIGPFEETCRWLDLDFRLLWRNTL